MNLYRLVNNVNHGYETFDMCIVAALNEDEARLTHPDKCSRWDVEGWVFGRGHIDRSWCPPSDVVVEFIGTTDLPKGVLCASYNAG